MRFVVYGAGAVGGVVGGRLHQHGHDVVLVVRGSHHRAIAEHGLRIDAPSGTTTLRVPAVDDIAAVDLGDDDVVLLAVKSNDTAAALDALAAAGAPTDLPIVCLQNGVENERAALRRFGRVHGVSVVCPTGHLEPGVVLAYSEPVTGVLDVGRYPDGADEVSEAVATAFCASTFDSLVRGDIMRWKWAKLLTNLGNAIEAVCGPPARQGPIGELAHAEGVACLRAAGIEFASDEEDPARRELVRVQPVAGEPRPGGSSWQSLARATGAIETDFLNGEIVLLGRLHGVPTPVIALLQQLANQLARSGTAPGAVDPEQLLEELSRPPA